MDEIRIDQLHVFAHHGVFAHEKKNGQNFFVNAVLYMNTEKAGMSDELACSVDYGSVCTLIQETMTQNTFDLIETAAQKTALAILTQFPLLHGVDIEIRKPEAPIAMQFSSVSVKIHRAWHTAVIALGSNIGDSRAYIENAVEELKSSEYIKDIQVSDMFITKPYGYTEQNDFLNSALVCQTVLSPNGLLDLMHEIEHHAGRIREIHWGPRTLDLDLIFFDDMLIDTPDLTVPHIDMQNRDFVLKPLAQIVPYFRHPVLHLTVAQLLERLTHHG